ncbi:stage III sporulation protein AE [Anaerofustis butyriciformans]|uniref:stage III sporulation protein AE n=1 Tax=Anaerofustis butyriciformans TaxID=3108533 RepID=UPI003F8B1186
MKKICFLFICFFIIACPGIVIAGEEGNSEDYSSLIDGIYEQGQIYKLDMYTNDNSFYELFNFNNIQTFIKDVLSGNYSFDYDRFINTIKDMFFYTFKESSSILLTFIALSICLSLINLLNSSFMNKEISDVAFFGVYLVLIMVVVKCFFDIVSTAYSLVKVITGFMNVLLPIIIVLLNLSGNVFSGNIISVSLVFIINFFASSMTYFIIPALSFGFILSIIDNILIDINISYLVSFIKQMVLFLMGIFSCLFLGILGLQGSLFSSIDSLSLKTAKFVVSNLVPVLGSLISDSTDTVIGFIKVIKSSVGIVGILIFISLLIIPLINMLCLVVTFKISAFLSQPITDARISKALNDTAGFLSLIFACFMVVSILFIMLIGIISMIGG